jgi:hypothetical protein
MTQEPQETYRKLAKTFRQAIQVNLKPIFSCQDNCGKSREVIKLVADHQAPA